MISLLLSILSSTVILIIFKVIEKQKIDILPPIVINYITASVLGFYISGLHTSSIISAVSPWFTFSIIIGILLIVNFFLLGNSVQKAGIAITTVSAKMSFVLPVLFSLLYDVNDKFSASKGILLLFAMVSVIMAIYQDNKENRKTGSVLFPILIFSGLGSVDSLVKYCQYHFISNSESSSLFSAFNFSIAGIVGLFLLFLNRLLQKSLLKSKVWLIGIILGAANFGSMYFLINALNELKFNNSLVFGINNIGIVLTSVIVAYIIYKERFSRINWTGLVLSVLVLLGMIKVFMEL